MICTNIRVHFAFEGCGLPGLVPEQQLSRPHPRNPELTSEGRLRRLNRIGDLHFHLRDFELGVQGRVRYRGWRSGLRI